MKYVDVAQLKKDAKISGIEESPFYKTALKHIDIFNEIINMIYDGNCIVKYGTVGLFGKISIYSSGSLGIQGKKLVYKKLFTDFNLGPVTSLGSALAYGGGHYLADECKTFDIDEIDDFKTAQNSMYDVLQGVKFRMSDEFKYHFFEMATYQFEGKDVCDNDEYASLFFFAFTLIVGSDGIIKDCEKL